MTVERLDRKPVATRQNYGSVSPSTFPIKGAGGNKTDFPLLHLLNHCLFMLHSSLPELLEKKRLIDMHTTIATALLDHIKVGYDCTCNTSISVHYWHIIGHSISTRNLKDCTSSIINFSCIILVCSPRQEN